MRRGSGVKILVFGLVPIVFGLFLVASPNTVNSGPAFGLIGFGVVIVLIGLLLALVAK